MEKQHIGTFSFSREWQRIRKETAEQAAHRLIVYPEGDMVSRHLSADSQTTLRGEQRKWRENPSTSLPYSNSAPRLHRKSEKLIW